MKLISIVTPCYNEAENIEGMHEAIREVFRGLDGYRYEHIFIDNRSSDDSARILRDIAGRDKRVKVILNARNFGPGRSGGYALMQARGDAVIALACDFQDPPELIPRFLELWEAGYKVVYGQKTKSEEGRLMFSVRRCYYRAAQSLSEVKQIENVTGFGLYDKTVIDMLRWMDDPNPFLRNTIADLGYDVGLVQYVQPKRLHGKSSYRLLSYLDAALVGLTHSTFAPLRFSIYLGLGMSAISFLLAVFFLAVKIFFWKTFSLGLAPILLAVCFFGSVQLAFIGVIGEYLGSVLLHVSKRPLVVERDRINFPDGPGNEKDA